MDGKSDEGWTPPRPPANTAVWEGIPAARGGAATPVPLPESSPVPPASETHRGVQAKPRRRGRIALLWARIGLGGRVLISYLGLAALIVAVTGVGAALQPSYGSLTPWLGIRVDDLRSAPRTSSWAVDLASALSPGSPPECLRYDSVDVGQDLVAVRAESAWTSGLADDSVCSVIPDGLLSRVLLMDSATGQILWVHDIGSDFSTDEGVSVASMSTIDHSSRLLVRAVTASQTLIESVSVASGEELDSTGPLPWNPDDRFTSAGDVVATGSLSADDLSYVYELRNANDLSGVVWRGTGNETATMIALDDRLLLGATGTLQIPLATGKASRWGGPVDTTLAYAVHDNVVFAQNTTGQGVTALPARGFSAVDKTGRVLWTSALSLRGSYSVTRSCLAVTDLAGNRLTCLDYRTGKQLWTKDVSSFAYVGGALGQRTDDIYTLSVGDQAQIVALDGATGRQRFSTEVPAGARVVAAGHTVAYALAFGISGSRSSVIALDTATGRHLWTRTAALQVSLWGGNLIEVGRGGLARRLDG